MEVPLCNIVSLDGVEERPETRKLTNRVGSVFDRDVFFNTTFEPRTVTSKETLLLRVQ